MYAIKWTRYTGETGVFAAQYSSKRKATAAKKCLLHMKGAEAYECEIIEL